MNLLVFTNLTVKETEFVNGCESLAAEHAYYKFVSVGSKSECKTLFWEEWIV